MIFDRFSMTINEKYSLEVLWSIPNNQKWRQGWPKHPKEAAKGSGKHQNEAKMDPRMNARQAKGIQICASGSILVGNSSQN